MPGTRQDARGGFRTVAAPGAGRFAALRRPPPPTAPGPAAQRCRPRSRRRGAHPPGDESEDPRGTRRERGSRPGGDDCARGCRPGSMLHRVGGDRVWGYRYRVGRALVPADLIVLDLVPQLVLAGQIEFRELEPALGSKGLDARVALDPSSVGGSQRLLGVELHPARQVDGSEEQVPQLVHARIAALLANHLPGRMKLLELLAHLLPDSLDRLPVPAHRAGTLLDLPTGG